MREGVLPDTDPLLLTRALLGLYNSIWHWYRPGGQVGLDELRRYFVRCELTILGCSPELVARTAPS
jgi:hypothetical protein